jgi:LacI family transcriptional regulator
LTPETFWLELTNDNRNVLVANNTEISESQSKMKVTLKQIAQHSGVSMPTVSEILNDKGVYSQQTREKVHFVAKQLGYRPNASARAIQSGKFNSITWLSSTHGSSRFMTSTLIDGLMEELDKHQMQLHIARIRDEQLVNPEYIPSALRHLSCDGLLIDYTTEIPARFWDLIQETRLPAIWINTKQKYDSVYPDDMQAMLDITRQFISKGHHRIGYLTPKFHTPHYSLQDRLYGYENAMQEAALEAAIFEDHPGTQCNRRLYCHDLVKTNPQITAWVCYGDTIAIHVCEQLTTLGYDVGKTHLVGTVGAGVSLPNFYMEQYPIHITPYIWAAVGQQAIKTLLKKIKNPSRRQASVSVYLES